MAEPLFLPKGSVRAIIAIALTATTCYMAVSSGVYEVPDWFIAILSAVIGHYFGVRTKTVTE